MVEGWTTSFFKLWTVLPSSASNCWVIPSFERCFIYFVLWAHNVTQCIVCWRKCVLIVWNFVDECPLACMEVFISKQFPSASVTSVSSCAILTMVSGHHPPCSCCSQPWKGQFCASFGCHILNSWNCQEESQYRCFEESWLTKWTGFGGFFITSC